MTSSASILSEVNPVPVGLVTEDRSVERPPGRSDDEDAGEEEPLLGGATGEEPPGDHSIWYNLVSGTAPLAQAGGIMLVVIVWTGLLTHKFLIFTWHPLLNSLGNLFVIEAILILQPTVLSKPVEKKKAAYLHAIFIALALTCFYSALAIIIFHKEHYHLPHFETPHSILGLTTYILLFIQALVGFTQLFVPQLYGGEDNAKKIYKYHRFFGYAVILPLLQITFILATNIPYVGGYLKIKTWAVVMCCVGIVAGIYPRINTSKMNVIDRRENAQ